MARYAQADSFLGGNGRFLAGGTRAGQSIAATLGEPLGDTRATTTGKGVTVSPAPAPSPVATSVTPTKAVSGVTASAQSTTPTYNNPSASPYTGGRLTI